MNLAAFIGLRYTGARRRSRSVSFLSGVSVTGLAVGISLLLLVLSVMNGFDRELRERILGLVPQAAVYHQEGIADWRKLRDTMLAQSGVLAASPFVELHGLVSVRHQASAVLLYGFDPGAEAAVSRLNEFVNRQAQQRLASGETVIVLGKNVAESLSVSEGERVMMVVPDAERASAAPRLAYFEVVQIVESKTELDASLALTSLEHAAALAGHPGRVTGLRLKLAELFAAPSLMYHLGLTLGPGYYTSNWTRTHWNLYQAIQMSKNLVGLLMSLIVAIAAFNVVSTLVLVVVDKQGDIAILRTLGASGRQIMLIFVVQGAFIGLLGTVLGVGMGCLLAFGVESFVMAVESLFDVQFLSSDVYPLTYLPTEIRAADILSVVFTALGMSFLATLYPAWKASRVQPAVALRYE